jgi:hypothetical protein
MIPKYIVEYTTHFRNHSQTSHHDTDDPVACGEFLEELLERGVKIQAVKHEGVDLPRHEFDQLIKNAAAMMTSKHICASLGINSEEERYRFGFAA